MSQPNRAPSVRRTHSCSLVEKVTLALAADPRFAIARPTVRIEARDGKLCLEGWVPSLADRIRMETVVADLVGSANLASRLLVGPPHQRPDAEIGQAVQDLLAEDRAIDATSIQVVVFDGIVHLSGIVDTSTHRRYVGALCWWVPGVRGVVNDLTPIDREPVDDEILAEVIQEILEKDPLVDRTAILVLCHAGRVTLQGTVMGVDARDAAESDAWAVEGVRDVINEIAVA